MWPRCVVLFGCEHHYGPTVQPSASPNRESPLSESPFPLEPRAKTFLVYLPARPGKALPQTAWGYPPGVPISPKGGVNTRCPSHCTSPVWANSVTHNGVVWGCEPIP